MTNLEFLKKNYKAILFEKTNSSTFNIVINDYEVFDVFEDYLIEKLNIEYSHMFNLDKSYKLVYENLDVIKQIVLLDFLNTISVKVDKKTRTDIEKPFWQTVYDYIFEILNINKDILDQSTVDAVRHYLNHDEYELAFEGLFIDIIKYKVTPMLDIEKAKNVAISLNLNHESVLDAEFWSNFESYFLNSGDVYRNSRK
ncbi:hypothetical protein MRY82_05095 [bacterium]|nr:hypothetical protein [bacterium]